MLNAENTRPDPRTRTFVYPTRIVWQSDGSAAPEHSERLLTKTVTQTTVQGGEGCIIRHGDAPSAFLLDFGRELHGGVQIIVRNMPEHGPVRLRVRFGESVSEAMGTPNQDHALHDTIIQVPWIGSAEIGNTGFRFVRIDTVDAGAWVEILAVRAVFLYRDLEYKGAFECDDERLNRIWQTGAYTVHLNMQDYVWDGIKRDRLVWLGDLHPETMVISTVFGGHAIVPETLDFARNGTPLPQFMNGMFSYSLWWVIIQRDWHLYHGDKAYLEAQRDYLIALLDQVNGYDENSLPGGFLDWPTSPNKDAVRSGMFALVSLAFRAGAELCGILGEKAKQAVYDEAAKRWAAKPVPHYSVKTTAALMTLAGMIPEARANTEVLSFDSLRGLSTFYGYYVLQARAKAGDYAGAIEAIRRFWGAMLDFGATTFWEDFNLDWIRNAGRIDELVPPGKDDLHADFGAFCYKGLRHSLCHGWSGGPTAWLSEHVLGFRPLEPGCRKLLVDPHLDSLDWARGAFPTPQGAVRVSHKRAADGTIATEIEAPNGIEIVRHA